MSKEEDINKAVEFLQQSLEMTIGAGSVTEMVAQYAAKKYKEVLTSRKADGSIRSFSNVRAETFSSLPKKTQNEIEFYRARFLHQDVYGQRRDKANPFLEAVPGEIAQWVYDFNWDAHRLEKKDLQNRCRWRDGSGHLVVDWDEYYSKLPLLNTAFQRVVDPGDPKDRVIVCAEIMLPLPINYISVNLELETEDGSEVPANEEGREE
jgi:hypothetical protein